MRNAHTRGILGKDALGLYKPGNEVEKRKSKSKEETNNTRSSVDHGLDSSRKRRECDSNRPTPSISNQDRDLDGASTLDENRTDGSRVAFFFFFQFSLFSAPALSGSSKGAGRGRPSGVTGPVLDGGASSLALLREFGNDGYVAQHLGAAGNESGDRDSAPLAPQSYESGERIWFSRDPYTPTQTQPIPTTRSPIN